MPFYKEYALAGGQPVKISPLEVTEPGTVFANEGCAFNPIICTVDVSAHLDTLTNPPAASDGTYIFIATDSGNDTVVGVCQIAESAIDKSYGDGAFAIDSTGDTPVIEWTPSVTAESVTVWYAASVKSNL